MKGDIEFENIEFGMYNRKSSEQEERQALSIESQKKENYRVADKNGIKIKKEYLYEECKSAKEPYKRAVFNNLIKDINKGKIQGIVAWHPDRLSRNPIDMAHLVDAFDRGKLQVIVTNTQVFRNTPMDKFMLGLACGQAKMENDSKGENVKRGLVTKREMGYLPGVAKIGYMNDYGEKGYRTIIIDPERFPVVKKVFKMYLTGKYTVRKLHRIATEEMGLTNIPRKKIGGKTTHLSMFYKMLQDPFYAGFFYGKDADEEIIRYEVNKSVPRVITEKEHKKILTMMKRADNPRAWRYTEDFPYKKFTKCGSCDGSITAENKKQMICEDCKYKFSIKNKNHCPKCNRHIDKIKNKVLLDYTYYHCCKKKDPNCLEKSITESKIDSVLIHDHVETLAISEDLRDWLITNIKVLEKAEKNTEKAVDDTLDMQINRLSLQKDKLLDTHIKGFIDDVEYKNKKEQLEDEIGSIKTKAGITNAKKIDIKELEKKLDILTEFTDIIENGDFEDKIEAISTLGSNLTLKSKTISITRPFLYQVIAKGLYEAKQKNPEFEPRKYQADKGKTEAFASVCPTLLRRQDSNLRQIDYTYPCVSAWGGLYHHPLGY